MKRIALNTVLILGLVAFSGSGLAAEKVLFDFESDSLGGWEVPDWSYEQDDYIGGEVEVTSDYAKSGKKSMKLVVDFPGDAWRGAIVEVMEYFDWSPYTGVACDLYVPADAPAGLKAKLVLTVGENWKWTEMSRSVNLTPGEWVALTADLSAGSTDWKRTTVTDEFRSDIRKIAVRIESNRKPEYKGPVYIDYIRLE